MALAAPAPGRLVLAATDLAMTEAQRRAIARRHDISSRSRSLCEDLAEHLGWLQLRDDTDRVAEVVATVGDDTAALTLCIDRLVRDDVSPTHLAPATKLAAIVDTIDAEMRLALLGDRRAGARARHLAASLSAGVAALTPETTP